MGINGGEAASQAVCSKPISERCPCFQDNRIRRNVIIFIVDNVWLNKTGLSVRGIRHLEGFESNGNYPTGAHDTAPVVELYREHVCTTTSNRIHAACTEQY